MAFNIRIYGVLLNSNDEVLLSDERRFNRRFTKFPGGGLEQGEGIKEGLRREFQEELQIDIKVDKLIYLTDFFQQSAFDPEDQIISIYYGVTTNELQNISTSKVPFDFKNSQETESFRWVALSKLSVDDVTFPIDKIVVELINQ